jgi:predicted acyl esterase
VLSTDVYRPRTDGGHPALLLRISYDKALARSYVYAHPIWYARQGWASSWSCRMRFPS